MGDEFYESRRSGSTDVVVADVKDFIKSLNRTLRACDVFEIQNLYMEDFQNLTERFFKGSPWPSAEAVQHADIIDSDDANFLTLYKELYFRHIYSKLAPSTGDRFDSFLNYTNLFNILLTLDNHKPELELPGVWLWDILDEFIYQFRTFHQMRAHLHQDSGAISAADVQKLKEAPHLWSAQTVCAYLDRMIKKGAEAGCHPFLQSMREFALIGMVRVMCLLGDYSSALELADSLDFNALKDAKSIGPYSALIYYVSFAYLMLRRYKDAISTASALLTFARRYRLEDDVPKAIYQASGIIAIARHLSPQGAQDGVATAVREKFGDRLEQMKRSDEVCREVFEEVAPKFISPCVPDYDGTATVNASTVQVQLFMSEVNQRRTEVHKLLRLCSTISTKELCMLAKRAPEALTAELVATKIKNKTLQRVGVDAPSQGSALVSTPVPFFIKGDFVHVAQAAQVDRYGDYFMSQFLQFNYMREETRSINTEQ